MNKKEKVLAIKSALTNLANNKSIVVVESLTIDSLKTKDIKNIMKNLKLEGKILFISAADAENLYMATRNLSNAAVIMIDEINVLDLTHADKIVMDEAALKYIEEAFN